MSKPMILRIVAGSLGFGILCWVGISLFETRFYRDALPAEIEVAGFVRAGSDFNPITLFVPIRHEACGAVVFEMAESTAEALRAHGIHFLKNAQQGRGYPSGSARSHYYRYEPWQETPLPPGWIGDGSWQAGLHCARLDSTFVRRITAAAREPGSYFATKPEAQLLVIPRLKLVVFTYFG